MLINTVILFLRDALPIFICLSLFISIFSEQVHNNSWLIPALSSGLVATISVFLGLGSISSLFDGLGYELLLSTLSVFTYIAVVNLLLMKKPTTLIFWLVLAVTTNVVTSGTNFLLFISGYWQHGDNAQPLLLGIILGAGICLSVSILLFFFTRYIKMRLSHFPNKLLLLLFASGQLAHSTVLLAQIDLFSSINNAWSTKDFISDSTVLGHFLSSLVGYEASPSVLHVAVYLMAFTIPLAFLLKTQQSIKVQKKQLTEQINNACNQGASHDL